MQRIGQSTELAALAAPRVWQETARALLETSPTEYFLVLVQADALSPWFIDLTASMEQIDSLAPAFIYLQELARKPTWKRQISSLSPVR